MTHWFTSDTHFGHQNCIKYSNRPFSSIDEMDTIIIDRINSLVKPQDVLYHLGDFGFGSISKIVEYRKRIKCKSIILISGNHDRHFLKKQTFKELFFDISPLLYYKNKQHKIELQLCHYSLNTWNKSHYGSGHLYGHSHGLLPEKINSLSFDVGVDCWNFYPINLEQVLTIFKQKMSNTKKFLR